MHNARSQKPKQLKGISLPSFILRQEKLGTSACCLVTLESCPSFHSSGWASFCFQSLSTQSEDCDDSSVSDSCGFVPGGIAGQSHTRQISHNSFEKTPSQMFIYYFLHSSGGCFKKFSTDKKEESLWEEQIGKWPWRKAMRQWKILPRRKIQCPSNLLNDVKVASRV